MRADDAADASASAARRHAKTARSRGFLTRLSSSVPLRAFSLSRVNLEITPEPSPEEREALLAALREVPARVDPYRSVWRLAGLLESVEADPSVAPFDGAPRRSPGASRA